MARRDVSFQAAFLAGSMLAWPAVAADVTPDRLVNVDKEPQNWLMNHRTSASNATLSCCMCSGCE